MVDKENFEKFNKGVAKIKCVQKNKKIKYRYLQIKLL